MIIIIEELMFAKANTRMRKMQMKMISSIDTQILLLNINAKLLNVENVGLANLSASS